MMLATFPQTQASADAVPQRIERVLEVLAPKKWSVEQRRVLAYELDAVHAPWQDVQQNAGRFYAVLPNTESLPRPYRAFLAMGVAVALGAVR